MPDNQAKPRALPDPAATAGNAGLSSTGIPVAPTRDLTGSMLGDFQVERLLGRGGMGEVYLARQLSLNREVALKVLRADLISNATYQARFEVEAWAAAKLNHANIVHIYTLGSFENLRFIAMEYVQGTNLREYLTRKGTIDLPLAMSIMRQSALAIGAAGELGLIHRDIKPENLMLTKKAQVKVADFGLCRDLEHDHHITQDGVTLGTPMYMSPEQVQGHPLDHRSDLYSLGVTYYHMLAGAPPFRAETALALALKHLKDTPVNLAVHRPDLPPELTALVMRLMAKSPNDRYQSAAEMLRDLARVREKLNLGSARAETGEISTIPANEAFPKLAAESASSRSLKTTEPSLVMAALSSSMVAIRKARPSRGMAAACLVGGLLAGAIAGWSGRRPDLLDVRSASPKGSPALWMAPEWRSIPHQATSSAQYRQAQMRTVPAELDAAWLAVPGFHPGQHEWALRAYTQFARSLFRRRDSERLAMLADALDGSEREGDRAYAEIFRGGVAALRKDAAGTERLLAGRAEQLTDPGLVELGAEIAVDVTRRPAGPEATLAARAKFLELQSKYMARLLQIEMANAGEPGRPG
ncbi:serine/threonine-protein kinase [Isosphaeraceae bacterium EP7]